jgi:hypothetical protein
MRSLTQTFKSAIFALATSEVFALLITIDHASIVTPIRICTDSVNVLSNARTFVPALFDIALPNQDDEFSAVSFTVDNVDRQIVQAIRTATGAPPTFDIEVCLVSDPNNVIGPISLEIIGADYNAKKVSCKLSYEPIIQEKFPADAFTPSTVPVMFQI